MPSWARCLLEPQSGTEGDGGGQKEILAGTEGLQKEDPDPVPALALAGWVSRTPFLPRCIYLQRARTQIAPPGFAVWKALHWNQSVLSDILMTPDCPLGWVRPGPGAQEKP